MSRELQDGGALDDGTLMGHPVQMRRTVVALISAGTLLLAGCGATPPAAPTSSNPLPAGAANTTSAPAYGADIKAAQSAVGQSSQPSAGDTNLP